MQIQGFRSYRNINSKAAHHVASDRRRSYKFHRRELEELRNCISKPLKLLDVANECIVAGRRRLGARLLQRGALAHPHNSEINGMLLGAHLRRGNIAKAERDFGKMVKIGIAEEAHYLAMINGLADAGMHERIGQVLNLAMETGMDTAKVLFAVQEAELACAGQKTGRA